MGNKVQGICSCFSEHPSQHSSMQQISNKSLNSSLDGDKQPDPPRKTLTPGLSRNSQKLNLSKQPQLTIDDFMLFKQLGQGAFSKVYIVQKKEQQGVEKTQYALKIIKKKIINQDKLIESTILEKNVLLNNDHPFITHLKYSFQSEKSIYFIMEYVQGGSLYRILREEKQFDDSTAKLILAEVILGIQFLHENMHIKYRDMKPENILVGLDGHIKITDFGLSKLFQNPTDRSNTFAGTPEYIAPEVLERKGHTKDVDLWGIGILLFELLTGAPPFRDRTSKNLNTIWVQILKNQPIFPAHISTKAKDLIQNLLKSEPLERLGSKNFKDLKNHAYFEGMNWEKLQEKSTDGPLIKIIKHQKQHIPHDNNHDKNPRQIYETMDDPCTLPYLMGITYNKDNQFQSNQNQNKK